MKKIIFFLFLSLIYIFPKHTSAAGYNYCDFSSKGNIGLGSSCVVYEDVNGLADGDLTVEPGATITLHKTLVFPPAPYKIIVQEGDTEHGYQKGIIYINSDGKIAQGKLCVKDRDLDGYPDTKVINKDPYGITVITPLTQIDMVLADQTTNLCPQGYTYRENIKDMTIADADPEYGPSNFATSDRELLRLGFSIAGISDANAVAGDISLVDKNLLICKGTTDCAVIDLNGTKGSLFIDGRIGIGVSNPSVEIDVLGNGKFSSTLTAANGFTLSTGALSLTSTSGSLSLSGLGASTISTGANSLGITAGALTISSTPFDVTSTGINSTAIGATTASTGVFTNLSSTGTTTIGNASTDAVTVNAGAWTLANDTNFALSGDVNGLSIDTPTFSVDSTNNRIGIGTTAPSSLLEVKGVSPVISLNNSDTITSTGNISITNGLVTTGEPALIFGTPTAEGASRNIAFRINGSNVMSLLGSGNVGIGTNAPTSKLQIVGNIYVQSTDDPGSFSRYSENANGSVLYLAKYRGTIASPTIVQNGDDLGGIVPMGYDGAAVRQGAYIGAAVDGAPGASDMPTRIFFSTTPDGSAAPTEKMRITNDGRVGIGITNPAAKLEVSGSVNATSGGSFAGATGQAAWITTYGTQNLNMSIKATNAIVATGIYSVSDKRLKHNIEAIPQNQAEKFISTVNPVSFNWNDTGNFDTGFIAQDLIKQGFTHLVGTIPNDSLEETTDSNGIVSPKGYQYIVNYDSIVPILTTIAKKQQSEITSTQKEIDMLKSEINDLKIIIQQINSQSPQSSCY